MYANTNTVPGRIIKVQKDTMQVVQSLTLPKGADRDALQAKIREALEQFGKIESCVANEQATSPYRVKFTEHTAAEQVVTNAQKVEGLYDSAYIAYNSRPYDDLDESGGEGRGW